MTKEVGIAIAAVTCCLIGVGGMGWHTETHQSVSQSDLSSDTPPDRPASDTSAQAQLQRQLRRAALARQSYQLGYNMGQSLFTDASLGMEQCGLAESAAQLPSCVNGGDYLDGCTAAWHDAQH